MRHFASIEGARAHRAATVGVRDRAVAYAREKHEAAVERFRADCDAALAAARTEAPAARKAKPQAGKACKGRSEQWEQERVVEALDRAGVLYAAIPNASARSPRQGAELKRAGMKAGIPDIFILDPPPSHPGKVGVALEMKTADKAPRTERAGRFSGARPEQREWLERLEARGWLSMVAYGAADALARLRGAGYPL